MEKAKDKFKKIMLLLLSFFFSIIILSVFLLVYNFSGVHVKNDQYTTDYKWESYQLKTTMSEGFSWLKMDSNGFNNTSNDDCNIALLLMGSSHMEAVNIPEDENTGFLLNKQLNNLKTYNIGVSGHDIYVCAKNINNAIKEYKPSKYVVVETSTVSLDNEKMKQVINNELETIPSYDSGIVYYVQKYCPAIKTLFKDISDWKTADSRASDTKTEKEPCSRKILSDFLEKMANACPSQKLIILYHPSYNIDEKGELVFDESNSYIDQFASVCNDNGIIFVDMTDSFKELYEKKHILAHGFINTAVGEGHLNKYGHEAIANELVKVIKEDQDESE